MTEVLTGTCLCGATGWTLRGAPQNTTICNCSVCRRYGAVWAYGYLGDEIEPRGDTRPFATGDQSMDFHACPTCGCVTHNRFRDAAADGRHRGAVNLRMADDPAALADLPLRRFDGADTFEVVEPDGPTTPRHVRDLWI